MPWTTHNRSPPERAGVRPPEQRVCAYPQCTQFVNVTHGPKLKGFGGVVTNDFKKLCRGKQKQRNQTVVRKAGLPRFIQKTSFLPLEMTQQGQSV